ncbi:MAG: site-specific integrase, partial [Ferruginibacter sp.]
MSNSFKLLFQLRKPKQYKLGPQPIYLRITLNGLRAEFSVQRECDPNLWNSESGRMIGKKEDVRILNAYLDGIVTKVYSFQNDLIQNDLPVTAEAIKNKLSGKSERARMLVTIFEHHNKEFAQLVGKEFAPSTLTRYETTLKHVVEFMKWKLAVSDIDIRKLDHPFIADFNFYLRTVKNCNNNSSVKYIKNFRKIIRTCLSNGWLNKDPFINFKSKIKEVERTFLSEEELQTLHEKEFKMDRLNQVKDIFIFSCYTGLAYIDAKFLTQQNIVVGIDGNYWIHTHRKKTDTPSHIPLLPQALDIVEKYKKHPKAISDSSLLPVLSNQKMNAYLKEIAICCGIEKELTFHIARHTFATTVTLSNNVPIESVSKMLGHKSLRTTQHYAKILDKKVSSDMGGKSTQIDPLPPNETDPRR